MSEVAAVAAQVAHDIRSPLAALNTVLLDIDELPEQTRRLTRNAIQRIQDIAADLLLTCSGSNDRIGVGREALPQSLCECVLEIVNEKRMWFGSGSGVTFRFAPTAESYEYLVRIRAGELKRLLSNLLDNAVEAIEGTGVVEIEARECGGDVELSIRDSGKGMSREVLRRIGRWGATFGKEGGSGIGLAYAMECVERWRGSLAIESREGGGTTVTVRLPRAFERLSRCSSAQTVT